MDFEKYVPNIGEKELSKHFFHEKKLASIGVLRELLRYNEKPRANHPDNYSRSNWVIKKILSYDTKFIKIPRSIYSYFTRLKVRPVYQLRQLIRLQNTAFIEAIYEAILQRPVDTEARRICLTELCNKTVSKVQMLIKIKGSEEASHIAVKVKGLFKYSLLTRFLDTLFIGNSCKFWLFFFQWLDTSIANYDLEISMHNNSLQAVEKLENINNNIHQTFADLSKRINRIDDKAITKEMVHQAIEIEQLSLTYMLKNIGEKLAAIESDISDIGRKYKNIVVQGQSLEVKVNNQCKVVDKKI